MQTNKRSIALSLGTVILASTALVACSGSPFSAKGADSAMQGKSADGSCGAKKKMDGSCGAKKDGSCGAKKKMDGSCGAKKDGSCGAKK
jgi:uncharacterized low-complexity protein